MEKIPLIPKVVKVAVKTIKRAGAVFCFLAAIISFSLAVYAIVFLNMIGLGNDPGHFYGFLCIFCNMLAVLFFVIGEELWKSSN